MPEPIYPRPFEDIQKSVADAVGRVRPTQLLADMMALVAYVQDSRAETGVLLDGASDMRDAWERAERERDAARELCRALLRCARSEDVIPQDLPAWLEED